jgi:hypothetical protein
MRRRTVTGGRDRNGLMGVSVRGSSEIHLTHALSTDTLCDRRVSLICTPTPSYNVTCPECLKVRNSKT